MPLRVVLKETVEHFIFKGADLMWPGIIEITDVRQQEDELRYR